MLKVSELRFVAQVCETLLGGRLRNLADRFHPRVEICMRKSLEQVIRSVFSLHLEREGALSVGVRGDASVGQIENMRRFAGRCKIKL